MSDIDGGETVGLEFLVLKEGIEKSSQVDNEMSKVVGLMASILNSSSYLSWDDFYKIYGQWYELQCLIDDGINIGELKMYKAFCEATRKNLIQTIGSIDNTKDFIRLILFIEDFRKVSSNPPLMDKFRWYLPDYIPQDMIDNAQAVWKEKILSNPNYNSDELVLVFPEQDPEGGFPDLDYLRFFYQRATEDETVSGWYEKFEPYMRPTE